MHCSVFKIFFLVSCFFALCWLHLCYICNNVFPCSTVLDMSCYTISRWGPEDAKNGVGVREVRSFTLDNCSDYNMFFLVISLSQLACYICTHVTYVPMFSCSIALDMSCLCYVYNTPVLCYICNKFMMGVTSLFCYICNSHSFLQMFAQHCYLCYKRQHPECQRKEL